MAKEVEEMAKEVEEMVEKAEGEEELILPLYQKNPSSQTIG